MTNDVRLGLLIWSHATDWPATLATAQLGDHLGYAHVWTSDHLLATVGNPHWPSLKNGLWPLHGQHFSREPGSASS